ncbi:MAG: biotin--[acetyl-CoA-carboxylase] ligase [Thiotrichales bacterium]|nr:biotin--[acetyl-CoA-carboxylase] ligase [Thiotrichales bacterium]
MKSIAQIQFEIQSQFPELAVFCFDELDSTSHYLKQYARTHLKEAFCLTLSQRSGYGQQSRVWQSDFSSITFSMLLNIKAPLNDIDGFTQLVGLKLIESLTEFSSEHFKLKWPNDLYVNNQKAGGILIECVSYSDEDCWLVVGIGLNNGLKSSVQDSLTGNTSIAGSISLQDPDKVNFLVTTISKQLELSSGFKPDMFKEYSVNYRLVDFFKLEQSVIVYDSGIKEPGLYKGLTDSGELLVEIDGSLQIYRSGQTSIRPVI